MSQRTLSRRLLVGATSGALLLGAVGFLPLLGSASAACVTYSDSTGDGLLFDGIHGQSGAPAPLNDDSEDILDVTHAVDGGLFKTTIHVVNTVGPEFSDGDEFTASFTVAGKAVVIGVDRGFNPGFEGATTFFKVAGTASTKKVTFAQDDKAMTMTLSLPVADFEAAVGAGSLSGKPFSLMTTDSRYLYPGAPAPTSVAPEFDVATASAKDTYSFGTACGGGTPVPTDSASPGGSPSPTATPSPTPPAGGGGSAALFDQPRKNCVTFKDPSGDADPTGSGQFSEDSLDVTQVNLKSAPGELQIYVGVVDPSAGFLLPVWAGRDYTASFTLGGKAVAVAASSSGPATATVAGKASTDLKATAKVDAAHKNLVFTIPLDGLAKATATVVKAGTTITATKVDTAAEGPLGPQAADTAAASTAAEKTYAYGDNTCFLPPAGKLSIDADAKGQYSDKTTMFVTLNDADDSPVEGATITAVLTGGKAASAVTDGDGIAELTLPIIQAAGTKAITATFTGTSDVGATKATAPFVVVAEKAVLKPVGIRGGASATLLDDDKHAIVGRVVSFTVGSRKYSVKTNAKGVAVLTHVAKGTAVKVGFAGVKGYYLATPTYTVKAT
jgi:hypothetical protein